MLAKISKNKGLRAVVALILIITMTLSNLIFLGKTFISYAFNANLESQGSATQSDNVNFDAYFVDDGGSLTHSVIFDVIKDTPKINLNLVVRNSGYLKEGYVEFRNDASSQDINYKLTGSLTDTTLVQSLNTNLKTITLNRIECGTNAIIEVPISFDMTELMNVDSLKQDSIVTLRGLYVDAEGREIEISKSIRLSLGWTIKDEIVLEQAVTKYIPTSDEVLIQTKVSLKQTDGDIGLPVKSTEIKVKVPEISEVMPEKAVVTVDETSATNGDKIEFTSENWTYNEEEKEIVINVAGYEEGMNIWAGAGVDEYFITYTYPAEVANQGITLHYESEAKMHLCSGEGIIEKTASSIGDIELTEKTGDVVTYSVDAKEDTISKGKMYANYNSDTKTYDTEYSSEIKVNVSEADKLDELYLDLASDEFVKEENIYSAKIGGVNYAVYKQIKISKDKLQKLLGEDAIVNVFVDGNVYTINSETEDVNGEYTLNFESANDIKIQTSKPIADGVLTINVVNQISKDLPYAKDQVKEFAKIKLNVIGYIKYEGNTNYFPVSSSVDTIELTETKTNAELIISNTTLSSVVENKNVEFKIVFNNNEENSDLYKNAVFTINLPKYIEDVEITGGNILYTDGLEIENVEEVFTENGLVLIVRTTGAEKTYSNGVLTDGTNLVLNTNIKVNEQAPNITDKIVMTYTNESAISYENNATSEVYVNIVAPAELVTYNSVLTSGIEAVSKDGNEQAAKLEILDNSKTATMKISILNKYSDVCSNIKILGRTPFAGNKSIETGADLGSTFDAKLISQINTNGINADVYYSTNETATNSLEDEENGWTKNILDLTDVKSYLIVLSDYEMQPGQKLEFTYDCQIPENLEHNESAFGTYVVYYDNAEEYITNSKVEATRVGLTTGVGANIEMATKVIYNDNEITDNDSVKEYQTVTYRTTIKNTGSVDAENVVLVCNVANGRIISKTEKDNVTQFTTTIASIRAGEEQVVETEVEVGKIDDSKLITRDEYYYVKEADGSFTLISEEEYYNYLRLNVSMTLTASNFDTTLTDKMSNSVEESKIRVSIYPNENSTIIKNGENSLFRIYVKNMTDETLTNVKVIIPVSEELSESISDGVYDEQNKNMTFNIESIRKNHEQYLVCNIKANIDSELASKIVKEKITATVDNKEYVSNIINYTIVSPILSVNINGSADSGSYVKEDQDFTIIATIRNTGEATATNQRIAMCLPEEFVASSVTYNTSNGANGNLLSSITNEYYKLIDIAKNEVITITARGHFSIPYDVEQRNVEVTAKIGEDKISNVLSYIIEKTRTNNGGNGPTDPTNPIDPTNPTVSTYKISGTAWLDANSDGQKQSDENLLEGINILLINANTGVIVTDITNGTAKEIKTGSNGRYEFTNIPAGQYVVVFEYDAGKYDVTEYNKTGLSSDLISKAIQTEINKDGILKVAAVSDTLRITNSSIANINIGLVEKEKFDLSLEKQIQYVTIVNSAGTNTYTFDNLKLGKIDIQGKYLNSTTAILQYKLTIKNEGAVAGYVKKIVDYKSKDLIFEPSYNEGWYIGSDGYLYNNSLANTLINPGESKEIILVLVKQMTEENTGIITNSAEIYEDYNELGLEDYNSKPANRAQNENDYSYADVIITVRTGQVALYILITIISVAIIAAGAYIINKKVLKGGKI